MTAIQSLEDLDRIKQAAIAEKNRVARLGMIQLVVSMGSCGIAAGALEAYEAVQEKVERLHLENVIVSKTGCIGLCADEPVVEVLIGGGQKTTYGHVTPAVVERIVHEHVLGGKVVQDHRITT